MSLTLYSRSGLQVEEIKPSEYRRHAQAAQYWAHTAKALSLNELETVA